MKRIGIAASRIAKDDLLFYNVFVLLISFLVSFIIFLVAAFFILAGVALISCLTKGFMAMDVGGGFFRFALIGLAIVTGIINLVAVVVNIKFKR